MKTPKKAVPPVRVSIGQETKPKETGFIRNQKLGTVMAGIVETVSLSDGHQAGILVVTVTAEKVLCGGGDMR